MLMVIWTWVIDTNDRHISETAQYIYAYLLSVTIVMVIPYSWDKMQTTCVLLNVGQYYIFPPYLRWQDDTTSKIKISLEESSVSTFNN